MVPAPVIVELDFWWRTKLTLDDYLAFLDDIVSGAYSVADLDDLDYTRARELQATYSGIGVSLVDASVLATVEKLGEPKLATLDHRHFSAMQPRHVGSLRLLP